MCDVIFKIYLWRGLLFRIDKEADDLLEKVCRQLTANIVNPKGNTSTWYTALFCSKDHATEFIRQVRKLIGAISESMRRCLFARHSTRLSVLFTLLVVLTDSGKIFAKFLSFCYWVLSSKIFQKVGWPLVKLPSFSKLKPIFDNVIRQSLSLYICSLSTTFRVLLNQWQTKTSLLLNTSSLSAMFVVFQRSLQETVIYAQPLFILASPKKDFYCLFIANSN